MATDSIYIQAAGDIAQSGLTTQGSARTGKALDSWVGDNIHTPLTILPLGDTAYGTGTLTELRNYFDPFWGAGSTKDGYSWKNKFDLLQPIPGNHEHDGNMTGYHAYFGATKSYEATRWKWSKQPVAPDGNRYWRIIGLDSDVDSNATAAKDFLRAELDASMTAGPRGGRQHIICCWHHMLWTTGGYAPGLTSLGPFTNILQDTKYNGVLRIVLNGHDHLYVRYDPLRLSGTLTQVPATISTGFVELLLGMGGAGPDRESQPPGPSPNYTNVAAHYERPNGGAGDVEPAKSQAWGVVRAELTKDSFKGQYVRQENPISSTPIVHETFTLGPLTLPGGGGGGDPPPPTNAITGYRFDWGDGTVVGGPGVLNTTDTHTYATAGTKTLTVTVYDSVGNDTEVRTLTITSTATPPTPALSLTPARQRLTGVAGGAGVDREYTATVTADATASTYSGSPLFTFDWGDGTAVTGPQASPTAVHTYRYNHVNAYKDGWGKKRVKVTLTDSNGTAEAFSTALLQRDHMLPGLDNGGV